MPKYIDADAFLLQYSILTSRPSFMPFSAEMSTWELWKQEFDRSVQLLVSRMITGQENDEQKVVAKIKEIPVAQKPIVCCKECKYFGYDYEYKHLCCTRVTYHPRVSNNDYCSYAERRKSE